MIFKNIINKYFSISIFIVTFFLISFVIYKSEIVWSGNQRENYFQFLYLILGLLLFGFLSLFFNQTLKIILTNTFVLLFFVTYILEICLIFENKFFIKSNNTNILKNNINIKASIYNKNTGLNYDFKNRFEAYTEFKIKYPDAVTQVGSQIINLEGGKKILSLSGVSNKKTFGCNENGYYSNYLSDRFGFNNPDYEWDSLSVDYAIIGDSFLDGTCVNRPHDISSVLRKITNKSILNLSYSGNGPLKYYATLKEYIDDRFRNILLFFFEGNDFDDLEKEINQEILSKYFLDENFIQNLKEEQSSIDEYGVRLVEQVYNERKKNLYKKKETKLNIENKNKFNFLEFIKLYKVRAKYNLFVFDNSRKNFEKILEKFQKLSHEYNAKIYVVYLPSYNRYLENKNFKSLKKVKQYSEKFNFTFINMDKLVFSKVSDPLKLFPFGMPGGHYNEMGYQKIAEAINNFLNINN